MSSKKLTLADLLLTVSVSASGCITTSSSRAFLFHLAVYLEPIDLLHVLQLTPSLHSPRQHGASGELWWTIHLHPSAPNRGMRPSDRKRDWRRLCFDKHDETLRLIAARNLPQPPPLPVKRPPREIMEPSPLERTARPKLTSEEKVEARAYYKDLKNKRPKGKVAEKAERAFAYL
ncbi:hypothetical protein HKX48_008152 [Thoreauomyces humboldtii]|nr:hypothetical protein HKX48_008152 [Thoreauomyces humboldtii]